MTASLRARRMKLAAMRRARAARPLPMGDLTSVMNTIDEIVSDPYLPEGMCRIDQIYEARTGQAVKTCAPTPPGQPSTIGLNYAMPVLRYVVYAEQHPWVWPATAVAIFGIPFLLGFALGSESE